MRITKQTGHAIRILIECATAGDTLLKVAELSERLDITRQNVFKVVNQLSHAGLVSPVRGPSGGVRLAGKAEDMRIGQIVSLLEHRAMEIDLPAGSQQAKRTVAPLKTAIDDAFEAFIAVLDQHTLADFAKSHRGATGGKARSKTKAVAQSAAMNTMIGRPSKRA